MQFDIDRSIDGAAHDVQAAINAATTDLPSDLPTRPYYRKFNPADAPIITLALTSKTLSPGQVYDAADTILAQRLSQLDGVSQVQINGAEKPAVRVRLNPGALRAASLSATGRVHRHPQRQRDPEAPAASKGRTGPETSPSTARCARPATMPAWSSSRRTAPRCGCRTSPAWWTASPTAGWRPGTARRPPSC